MSGLVVNEGLCRDNSSHAYSHHRRSRRLCFCASERNINLSKGGGQHCVQKDFNESSNVLPPSTRSCRASPLHESNVLPPSTRSCRASPLHEYFSNSNSDVVPNDRASLEKDIEQLQLRLQQERSMRMLLERAMGRTSSTLSPGHRHFSAQTKELIAEIESLEEEVANREQYVLTLYRNIFEQCTSRPSSEQSSVVTSPAHSKSESRKHPSIISSAFCSSKKFPLRTFQALAAINESGKRNSHSKTKHTSFFSGKTDQRIQKSSSENAKDQRWAQVDKAPLIRTLKDHLHQCPSKLSVEMVRCMSAVYCWLRKTISVKGGEKQSALSTMSSSNVIIPRRDIKEEKDWFCKSTVEISWISTDKNNFSRASYAINNYRLLVEQLEKVDFSQMETNAKIAFWINLYNSLVMHAYLAYGIPQNYLRRLALFHKAAYNVAGHVVSANAIEQSIFCLRTPRIGRWLEAILSTAIRKKSVDERERISSKFGLKDPQPLVCFALCTGAFSDPMLKVYTASKIKEELEIAKREFLQANIVVKKSRKVVLPKVLERYAKEACIPSEGLLKWIMENVDKKLRDSIQKCMEHRTGKKKASQIIEWSTYNSRFQYVISKDLADKPWWA